MHFIIEQQARLLCRLSVAVVMVTKQNLIIAQKEQICKERGCPKERCTKSYTASAFGVGQFDICFTYCAQSLHHLKMSFHLVKNDSEIAALEQCQQVSTADGTGRCSGERALFCWICQSQNVTISTNKPLIKENDLRLQSIMIGDVQLQLSMLTFSFNFLRKLKTRQGLRTF